MAKVLRKIFTTPPVLLRVSIPFGSPVKAGVRPPLVTKQFLKMCVKILYMESFIWYISNHLVKFQDRT